VALFLESINREEKGWDSEGTLTALKTKVYPRLEKKSKSRIGKTGRPAIIVMLLGGDNFFLLRRLNCTKVNNCERRAWHTGKPNVVTNGVPSSTLRAFCFPVEVFESGEENLLANQRKVDNRDLLLIVTSLFVSRFLESYLLPQFPSISSPE
jgi:hypothetical protein